MTHERIEVSGDQRNGWDLHLTYTRRFAFSRATVTAILIDGSMRRDKFPDSIIATRDEQEAFARRLAACWNHCRDLTDEQLKD